MADDLTTDDVARAFDYLGKPQPIGQRRLALTTATGGGPGAGAGAGITAPAIPSIGQRALAARNIVGGPSGAQQLIGDIALGKSLGEKALSLRDLFPSERIGQGGTNPDPTSPEADQIAAGSTAGAGAGAAGAGGGATAAASEAASQAARDALSVGGEGANLAGSAAGAAGGALNVLGGALQLAQDIAGNAPPAEKALDAAVDVAATVGNFFLPGIGLAAPVVKSDIHRGLSDIENKNAERLALIDTNPVLLPITVLADVISAVGGPDIFAGLFPNQLSHKQREQIESGKLLQGAGGEQGTLGQSKTLDDLWKNVVAMQSGSVGGKDSPATVFNLPLKSSQLQAAVDAGAISLPTSFGQDAAKYLAAHPAETLQVFPGNPNPHYPVWTQQGFFTALQQNPRALRTLIQGGVSPDKLSQGDQAITNTLLRRFQQLSRQQEQSKPPVRMPPQVPQPVIPEGPAGALPLDPTAGP